MTEIEDEAARVREAYRRRAERGLDARYDYWEPANVFVYQSRERALLAALREARLLPLTGRRVLDVGCGDGRVLADMTRYGARDADLCGVDLLADRVERARVFLPGARIEVGDAQALPFESGAFDLVLGFTLLSSVTDEPARHRVTAEMRRVLGPDGLIVLYDFRLNPTNRDVRALPPAAVRRLFSPAEVTFRGTTLAPPLVRALAKVPGGWLACTALEMIPFLRTHYIATVRPL